MTPLPLGTLGSLLLGLILLTPAAGRAATILDEVKLGVLAHDVPVFDDQIEHGVDANGELLFASPVFLAAIGAPRPHLGLTVNTAGKTSYAYAGLTWTAALYHQIFGALGLGGAIHDESNTGSPGHVGLGTRLLFHEEADLGYHFSAMNVSLFLDHISNAGIGRHNPGMTNLGIRTGFSF